MASLDDTNELMSPEQMTQIKAGILKILKEELISYNRAREEVDQAIEESVGLLKKLRRNVVTSHFANMKNNENGQKNRVKDAILKQLEDEDEAKDLSVFLKSLDNMSSTSETINEPTIKVELLSKPSSSNPSPSVTFTPPIGRIHLAYVIGNTVKVSGSENEMKYKWTVYVRNLEEGIDNLIYIDKVRYFLHESYEPNHIIDVLEKPFSLTRHGWGEFVVRLRLYFKGNMNVQTDVYHKVHLNKGLAVDIPMVAKEQVVKYNLLLQK
ncbi:YEATS domain-containing protein 2 [Adelges cooleyi]|uniref:YEATS domain-containing protein 2 n=1 Tax=Adelges cooleyi TaxID=133065 RepID=UPI0021804F05|nr:YEATS domain-containing protein 2 [Adelges cooleyi]